MALRGLPAAIATNQPSGVVGAADAGDAAAYAAFTSISEHIGRYADEQAKIEGARQGAVDGLDANYVSQGATTIRGRARDAAGDAAFLAQTQANFASDAMDALHAAKDDPAAFKAAYAALEQNYRAKVQAAGPHLVGDFTTRATTLGTSLRMKALDAFEAKQNDQARARLFDTMNAHQTSVAKLAAGDPEGAATLEQARAGLRDTEAAIDANVAAGTITAEAAAKQKSKLRSDTLLTLYSARADKMTDPAAIVTLRQQVAKDFRDGKIPLLDGPSWQGLDAGLEQLARKRQTEATAAQKQLRSDVDDFVTRNSKGLTPPAGELEALRRKAAGVPDGMAIIAEAQGKLQIEQTMGRMSAVERKTWLSRLESDARTGLPEDGAKMTAANWSLSFYKPADLLAPTAGGQAVDARAAMMADRTAQRFFDETGIRVAVNDTGGGPGTAGKRRGASDPNDNPHVPNSQHIHGRAFDFQTQGLSDAQKARFLQIGREEGFLGVGFYKGGAGHLHLDAGAARVWDNGEGMPDWAGEALKTRARPAGMAAPLSRVVEYARDADARLSRLEKEDPITAGERSGIMPGGQAAPLDLSTPDALAASVKARMAQGEAIGKTLDRAPAYFRPEERKSIAEKLQKGGTAALGLIDGVIAGAGPKALDALAEIGGDAPELAHAAMIGVQSGDDDLKRQVAAALEARRVPNAKPIKPKDETMETALKQEAGDALRGLSLAQRERIKSTAALAYEQAAAQRGLDKDSPQLAADMVSKALGKAKIGDAIYGGVTDYRLGGWLSQKIKVQVPPDVRQDRFGEALRALGDADLAKLTDPPVRPDGRPLTAAELLSTPPIARAGGYVFGHADATTGEIAPVKARSGAPFVLSWALVAPDLKKRVPGAFR